MKIINQENYLNYNIIEYDIVNSTMLVIRDFPENTLIVAKKQENGKGKGERQWISEISDNLYFSININANKKKLDYSQFSFISSLAMRQSIKKYDKNNNIVVSKWPNDILVNEKKVCGILLELDNSLKKLVIGLGVNINLFPNNNLFKATSLKNEKIIIDKYSLLREFLNNFDLLKKEWELSGFLSIREKWLKSCYKLNEKIIVNNQIGIFKNIDNDGTLIIELENGVKYLVSSGDVF